MPSEQGAVIWVFISEIFPEPASCEKGQTLGSATHWAFAALLDVSLSHDGGRLPARLCVSLFRLHDGAAMIWVKTMVPETKQIPLEQMQKRLGIE